MWIFDSYYKGCVHLWARSGGLSRTSIDYPQSFYLHLKDSPAHGEMIEALESLYRVEECSFKTIYGPLNGHQIYAGRSVAEKIEMQTHYAAELYNVDVRRDQQYLAERDLFPCGEQDESRFSLDFSSPLHLMDLKFSGDPIRKKEIYGVEVLTECPRMLEGREGVVLSDLLELIKVHDPDVILLPHADLWMQLLVQKAKRYDLDQSFSRSGWFRHMAARSYWSYGKVNHKDSALIPEGRVLIDTARSFTYQEGGLKGILLASRLTGLSPNLAARFTPGTLISSFEVYEALRRGVAVPFRKRDVEHVRNFCELKSSDKGGMMFQPEPGLYEKVSQLDFTSLYPSIIVKYNLSPETLEHPEKKGFLASVLSPLLSLRIETKRRKKTDVEYSGMDSILKWMLVTCFGYTGYRNARFGQIEVHERITAASREILLQTKNLAESMNLEVLHGIVDCLWVVGEPISKFKQAVERETGIKAEVDYYDWIVFLPMADGCGAYNRYFGRLDTGEIKIRGVMARKGDTPEHIRSMQLELFDLLADARSLEELVRREPAAWEIRRRYLDLKKADVGSLVIRRKVSKLHYSRKCAEASAVKAHEVQGIAVAPGMEIGYVVKDASCWEVVPEDSASEYDAMYYRKLLEKAWREVAFVFERAKQRR